MGLEQYDAETIEKAFWLQAKIEREGVDAIHYMRAAKEYTEDTGPTTVAGSISAHFRNL